MELADFMTNGEYTEESKKCQTLFNNQIKEIKENQKLSEQRKEVQRIKNESRMEKFEDLVHDTRELVIETKALLNAYEIKPKTN